MLHWETLFVYKEIRLLQSKGISLQTNIRRKKKPQRADYLSLLDNERKLLLNRKLATKSLHCVL